VPDPLPFDPIYEARRQWRAQGWTDAAGGMAAVTSVMRAQQLLLARVDAVLEPFELTFSRFEVLALLAFSRQGELPLGKIGRRLQVHAASVTNAVQRLEAQRLVRRRPHPTDGRTVLAQITPKGQRVMRAAAAALNAVFAGMPLGAAELDALVATLQTLRHDAGDFVRA
jgi:DNA-binding MarR family transcriptional regulator